MARVTSDEVKAIIQHSVGADLTAFITPASLLVDKISGLSDSELKEIERWLSAHFVSVHALGRQSQSETLDGDFGNNVTYQGQTGKGFESSFYGQTAMTLDTTGKLRQLSEGDHAESYVVSVTREDAYSG